jgi:hypothetical protein
VEVQLGGNVNDAYPLSNRFATYRPANKEIQGYTSP